MSNKLYVITNSLGQDDRTIIYETCGGEVILDTKNITAKTIFDILLGTNGVYEYFEYREMTDEQIDNWEEELYR